jgi:hypothetical protein
MDRRSVGRPSRLAAFVALVAASLLTLAPPAARPVAAAEELRLTADSTYVLDPEAGAVHVTIDLTATNLKPNTVRGNIVTSYYWDRLTFGIHDQAASIRATSSGRRLTVSNEPADGYRELTVRLANQLTYRETQRIRVQFDLPGGAPRSDSPIRVGSAFATFYAWTWGNPGRSSVTIRLPAGYVPTTNGADLERSTEGGDVILRAEGIDTPGEWYVAIDAERPRMLVRDPLVIMAGARIAIHGWPEDDEWRRKVHDLMEDGLPVLHRFIGLDWPVAGELGVYEVHTPLLEGYAGIYFTDRDRIEIGEELDDQTIIHEASHAWFNGDLFANRWISEGFAEEYAWQVLDELGMVAVGPESVGPNDRSSVPLNLWLFPGRITNEATEDREQWGYAASWTVIRALVDEIGIERMREVIAAADADETAYRGAGKPERAGADDDWRRFLDLLTEIGGSEDAEALFREWVIVDGDRDLLDERAEARTAYAGLLEAGDGWEAPWTVRQKLSAWDFDHVEAAVAAATDVLEARDELDERADALGVDRTDRLEDAYESAVRNLDVAVEIAAEEDASLDALESAKASLARERDVMTELGLWNEAPPELRFDAAVAAFESDAHETVIAEAEAARSIVDGAAELGRSRATTIGIGVGATVLVLLVVLGLVVRRRRRRAAMALRATLAAQSPAIGGVPDAPAAPTPDAPAASVTDPPVPDERGAAGP